MESDIFKIAAAAVLTAVIASLSKRDYPTISMFIIIVVSIGILLLVMPMLSNVIGLLKDIGGRIPVNSEYILIILKIIGIAYIAEFGSQICTDAGESSLASKVELAGKIIIMAVSVPIITALLQQIVGLLP